MPKFYEGSHQQYDVICRPNVMIPMRDGVCMATDIYVPAVRETTVSGKFPTILERTPYDKAAAGNVTNGTSFAGRGFLLPTVVLLEDDHPPQCGIIPRSELIEIDPACDQFTGCVAAVPIRRLYPSGVIPRRLMP